MKKEWYFRPGEQSDQGGCMLSMSILNGGGELTWCFRHRTLNRHDTGWVFCSDIDDNNTVKDPDNFIPCSFQTVYEIEPAVLAIFNMPPRAEVLLRRENGKITFINAKTGALL